MSFERATSVFQARVTSLERNGETGEVHFEVDEIWKSDGQPITAMLMDSNCSFPFTAVKRYIVFVQRFTSDPGQKVSRLDVDICSRTTELSHPETVEEVLALEEFLRDRKPDVDTH